MNGTRTDPARAANAADQGPEDLEGVIAKELDYIREHRHHEQEPNVVARSLIGLALSGGGIRSATTNLGVLQGLSRMDVLPMVDYLSTVSGGGYIGGCLTSLLSWNGRTDTSGSDNCAPYKFERFAVPRFTTVWESFPFRTEELLGYDRVGRDLVAHLRTHGNFLIARWGILRREAMRSFGTIVTGIVYSVGLFLLTLFAISALFLAAALAIAPDLEVTLSHAQSTGLPETSSRPLGERDPARTRVQASACNGSTANCVVETRTVLEAPTLRERIALNGRTLWQVLVTTGSHSTNGALRTLVSALVFGGILALIVFFGALLGALHRYLGGGGPPEVRTKPGESEEDAFERHVLWRLALLTVVVTAGTFIVLRDPFHWIERISAGALQAAWPLSGAEQLLWLFIPFFVIAGTRIMSFLIGVACPRLAGRLWTRRLRSLWGAFQATTIYGWWLLLLFGLLPLAIYALRDHTPSVGVSAIASLVLARMVSWRKAGDSKKRFVLAPGLRNMLLGVLITLVIVLTILFFSAELASRYEGPGMVLVLGLSGCALVVLVGYVVDHNKLSLHYFYRDRLGETYLLSELQDVDGAMRLFRDAMEMPLHCLHGDVRSTAAQAATVRLEPERKETDGKDAELAPPGAIPWRNPAPYHLISAAINLTGSRDLTRKDRKSDYWLFSKLYCGSTRTGFRMTRWYRNGETKLARAIAISGAAASAAIGYGTFFAQAFATVLFNVRLGYWMENPRYSSSLSREEGGVFWPEYLWREVTMNTVETTRLVNLSDGGHTGDNVGIYPLLQRRCKVIIACDAEQDARVAFGSFTEALRHAYVDMGIDVDIDLTMIRPDPITGISRSHCAVGRIRYPDRPDQASYLIYLKNSLTGDEPEPVLNYKTGALAFPHESTADQFFNDAQFESYRALGVHIAEHTFGSWVTTLVFKEARQHHTPTALAVER